MFDLTTSPEFMDALTRALVTAVDRIGLTPGGRQERSPEHDWLSTAETLKFLRLSKSAFTRFKQRAGDRLIVSTGINPSEPRYQLASLQKLMLEKSVGLPLPEPAPKQKAPAPLTFFPGLQPTTRKALARR